VAAGAAAPEADGSLSFGISSSLTFVIVNRLLGLLGPPPDRRLALAGLVDSSVPTLFHEFDDL
jgi:hypothetical protein